MSAYTLPSFYRLLGQHRFTWPRQEALLCGESRLSYTQLFERVNRLANALAGMGVGEKDRVLWLGHNSHAMLELLFACSRLGAAVCFVNWRQSADELRFVLDDFAPKAVLWQADELGDAMSQARDKAAVKIKHWISLSGTDKDSYEATLARSADTATDTPAAPDTERALLVLYTAAFGGTPNGAQISEPGLYLQALMHVGYYEASHRTRTLVISPSFHITGWLDLLPTFISGGTVCIAPRAEAADVLELISRERLTNGTIHPPTAKSIAELNADRSRDLSCFRSPLNVPGWAEMTSRGPGISGTGQTEVVGPIVAGALAGEGSTPFCGRVSPIAEARVAGDDGNWVEPGQVGELQFRGPIAGLGYWNRPELNAQRTTADGWWRTRDLARRDHDGTISFVGPIAQMVKSGGENVYASEVENVLKSHAAVANAAIIGTADNEWGQLVTAVIVLKPGQQATKEELQEHVRARIARYKAPRIVHFTDALPMKGFTPDYKALDAQFGGGGYPGEAGASNIGAAVKRA